MIAYRIMIRERFPDALLRQVIVYTGREPRDRSRLGTSLNYDDRDEGGRGIVFSASLRDFRATPATEFLRSGRLDDLILGLMAAGGDDQAYVAEVLRNVRAASGEARRLAREKYLAVCATMTNRAALRGVEDLAMWLEDVKDSPFIQEIVEIAGKARIEAAMAQGEAKGVVKGLARSLIRQALRRGVALPAAPEEVEALLTARADEAKLDELLDDIDSITDFAIFLKAHGVDLGKGAS
jgi:hypothetical protein